MDVLISVTCTGRYTLITCSMGFWICARSLEKNSRTCWLIPGGYCVTKKQGTCQTRLCTRMCVCACVSVCVPVPFPACTVSPGVCVGAGTPYRAPSPPRPAVFLHTPGCPASASASTGCPSASPAASRLHNVKKKKTARAHKRPALSTYILKVNVFNDGQISGQLCL